MKLSRDNPARWVVIVSALLLGLLLIFAPRWGRSALGLAGELLFGQAGALSIALETGVEGQETPHYRLASVLSRSFESDNGRALRLLGAGQSIAVAEALRTGTAEFGLVYSNTPDSQSGMLNLARIRGEYLHVVVPADSQVRSFRDLAGLKVGLNGSGSVTDLLGRAILGYFAFANPPDVVNEHDNDLSRAFLAGEIHAALMIAPIPSPEMETLLEAGWYRIVPLPDAEAMAKHLSGVYADTLPYGLYGPDRRWPALAEGPFPTLRLDTLLAAGPRAGDTQVAQLLATLHGADFLRQAGITDLRERYAGELPVLPQHPSATAFLHRNDPLSRDQVKLLAYAAMGFVLLAGALSALWPRLRPHWGRPARLKHLLKALENLDRTPGHGFDAFAATRVRESLASIQKQAEQEWRSGRIGMPEFSCVAAAVQVRLAEYKMGSTVPAWTATPRSGARHDTAASFETDDEAEPPMAEARPVEGALGPEVDPEEDEAFSASYSDALANEAVAKSAEAASSPPEFESTNAGVEEATEQHEAAYAVAEETPVEADPEEATDILDDQMTLF